jgi:hypothetical protein
MLMRVGEFAHCADGAAQDALRDQLVAFLPSAARITAHGWRPWASASFVGARHWFDVQPGETDDAADMARALGQREWQLKRRFVADTTLQFQDGAPGGWRIELLTVDS